MHVLLVHIPLKAASAFMFFLVQSAHLARPTTNEDVSLEAALATAITISTAQTPGRRPPSAAAMFGGWIDG
jgi:hypothetical protein